MKKYLFICLLLAGAGHTWAQNDTSKQFMLIIRYKQPATPFPQQTLQTNIQHWNVYMGNLGKNGKIVQGFRPVQQGVTISGTQKTTLNTPYISNGEAVSSFIIIKASSLDEATQIAKECPVLELDGSVEVRELMQLAR